MSLCRLAWLLLITAVLLPLEALASTGTQTANYGNFYVGLGAGLLIPQSTTVSVSGSVTGSGDVNYKNAAAILGMAGYHFTDYLTGEAELGYSSFDYKDISGTLTAGILGTGSGSIGVNGHVNALAGLLNFIVNPLGNRGISPYVGGGIGFANSDTKVNSVTFRGSTTTVNSSQSNTDLALDALIGVDIPIAGGFSLGGRYQFLWVNSSSTSTGGGATVNNGNFGAHLITARATYHF